MHIYGIRTPHLPSIVCHQLYEVSSIDECRGALSDKHSKHTFYMIL